MVRDIPRRRAAVGVVLLAAAASLASAASTFTVKYRSAASVYLDGGAAQGLALGDRLLILSGADPVAELEVVFLAEQSASCRIVSETRTVRAGDTVVPARKGTPEAKPQASASPPPEPPSATATPPAPAPAVVSVAAARPWARVRGGIALGYYVSRDASPSHFDFDQRTARVDLTLWDLGGRPYTLNVRFRSRQDIRSQALGVLAPQSERNDRLYELSFGYDSPEDRFAYEVGRIGVSRFVGVGYLDGGLARMQVAPRVQLGGFFGRRADIDGLGFVGSGQKYGGFLRLAPQGRYASGYEAVLAVVRELEAGEISREYVSLESRVGSGPRWSVFERAEVDVNRGWRQELTGSRFQLSTLSLSTSVRLGTSGSAVLAYDTRRNHRDATNRTFSDALFDNLLHQGLRLNLAAGRPDGLSMSGGAGVNFRAGDAQKAYSYNASVRHGNLFGSGLFASLDAAAFQSGYTDGFLYSASAGRRFGAGHQLDLAYGGSHYTVKANGRTRAAQWLRFTGHGELGHGLSLLGDLEYDQGDDVKGPRGSFELAFRF